MSLKAAQQLGKPAFTCALAGKSLQRSINMNTKRLILAVVVAFVVLWVTDFLIHGVWITPDYRATQQLWRTDAEMQSHMAWMLGAQFLFVITFVILWAKGFASHTRNVGCAVGYGLLMGLFSGVWAIIYVRCHANAWLNSCEMVLCRHCANNLARSRYVFCLQAKIVRDQDVTR